MSLVEGGVTELQIDRLFAGLQLQLQPDIAQKPELAPEIIEAIVDEVATQRNSEDTLKICLQVARSFVYPAQKYLFKSIDLTAPQGRSGRRKAQKFWYHLLKSSPHIGVHVRNLAIGGDTEFRCYLPEKCERSTWTNCTWITCAATNAVILLPQILPLLSNLDSFTFCNVEEPRDWLEIPEASRTALERLFQTGSLRTVKLSSITHLTSQSFSRLFYIPNFILSNVTMDEQGGQDGIRILDLSIGSDTTYQRYRPGKCERSSWTTCTWVMGATSNTAILPPQILPLLANLRSLDLSFSDSKPRSWPDIPEASQSALERLFQTGTLQTVKLSFITGLTSRTLARLLNIPNLTLTKVTVTEHDPYTYSVVGRIKLQTLTFSEFSPSVTRALARLLAASSSTGSFSKLSIDAYRNATGFRDAFEELIKAAGYIKQFEWPSRVYPGDKLVAAPAMRLFPRLSMLRVEMGFDNDFLRQAVRLLRQISDHQTSPAYDGSNGGIKHLIIVCYSSYCNPTLEEYTPRWNVLDKILSGPGLTSLSKITFAMFDTFYHHIAKPFLERNVLPMQRVRGVLVSVADYKPEMRLNRVA